MDGFHVKFAEAVCLGASLTFSGVFYFLYKKSRTSLNKLDVGVDWRLFKTLLNFIFHFFPFHFIHVLSFSHRKGICLL